MGLANVTSQALRKSSQQYSILMPGPVLAPSEVLNRSSSSSSRRPLRISGYLSIFRNMQAPRYRIEIDETPLSIRKSMRLSALS